MTADSNWSNGNFDTNTDGNASTTTSTSCSTTCTPGTTCSFEQITAPGCYVGNATGHLLRVYNSFDARNWNSSFGVTGNTPFTFTFVSNDPTCDVNTVRENACGYGLNCNF